MFILCCDDNSRMCDEGDSAGMYCGAFVKLVCEVR